MLDQMENGGRAPPALQNLQRQLADLQLTPIAGGSAAKRSANRSAPRLKAAAAKASLALGEVEAALAQQPEDPRSTCASGRSSATAGSCGSPRIPAAPAQQSHEAVVHGAGEPDNRAQSNGEPRAFCLDGGGAEGCGELGLHRSSVDAGVARHKLQRLLEVEMARETERTALLRTVAEGAHRSRLLYMFETERASAMDLMHQLQRQLS